MTLVKEFWISWIFCKFVFSK